MATPASAPSLAWVGDRSLRLSFGEEVSEDMRQRVHGAFERLRRAEIPGVVALTPAYATVLVEVDLARGDPAGLLEAVRAALAGDDPPAPAGRLVEVPVCYDDDFGPDLAEVGRLRGLTREDVVRLHSSAEYVVHFLGFTPGFPYLGGLPAALATPRLERPRVRVPAGSVAVAGAQAGIYPQATPGGWRLLGRTPLRLFDAAREPASLLGIGDRVRFVPIPRERFEGA